MQRNHQFELNFRRHKRSQIYYDFSSIKYLYITFCVSGNSDVRYWLDTILTVHVCININGRIDSIQCTDSVSNCSMINCIHLCAENKEICHIFNAWLIYKVILFIKDIYSTEEREGMRGYLPDINKYSTETRGSAH